LEPAGDIMNYLVLGREILDIADLTLTEKVVLAYIDASEDCEPGTRNVDCCARFLDISESEARRAWNHIRDLGLLEEES